MQYLRVAFAQWGPGPSSGDEYGFIDTPHVPRQGELVSILLRAPGEDREWSPETKAAMANEHMQGRVEDVQYHVRTGRGQYGGEINATVFVTPVNRNSTPPSK